MKLNDDKLQTNVQRYLASPAAERVWDEFENSVLFNVIASFFFLLLAIVLLCTIVFARIGFELIKGIGKSFISGEIFQDRRKLLQSQPDQIKPVITAGIIIGPQGHALVLGSFSRQTEQELTSIGKISSELGKLYTQGSHFKDDQPMLTLLKDDVYIKNRRRAVLESHSEGLDLLMFDLELKPNEAHLADGVMWVACVAEEDEEQAELKRRSGHIIQIPWKVVASAVE
jgi:hypothetical protein